VRKTYGRLRAPLSIIAAMVAGLLAVPALASAVPGFQDNGITQGPDGNAWFTVFNTHRVGRITPAGAVQQFAGATGGPADIVTGPDGALWFTEYGDKVGRVTTTGKVKEFPVPFGNYRGIATGPDGRLWFIDKNGDKVIAMTTAGAVSVIQLAKGSSPIDIASGPDGNLWVTLFSGRAIVRVTPAGAVTMFPLPGVDGSPAGITAGPDGALWFVEAGSNRIGRVATDGTITEFPGPAAPGGAFGIASGPDGALWIANQDSNTIGRLTTAGVYSQVPVPTARSRPIEITAGADKNLWFTQNGRDSIGRVAPPGGPVTQFAVDTVPPKAKVTTRGTATGANATIRCSEACTVSGELLAPRAVARKLGVAGRGPLVSLGRSSKTAPARKQGLSVRVSRGVAAKLAARGSTSLRFVFTIRDRQTNERIIRRTVAV
jgi:virginiamycin B lyase